ncbi:predicted protein [Uncinocarpus reesii 1704]|uniref:Yeast cell wall synthesis Kre9/Knh1 C-terminal domain-containing protein n=1 Tax=Uncinocarpus reesii (strain UAMH 1704) TaxID=336963 RepID=C4K0A2_UNCRE|nr:uncharacterized protein UREG_07916 [Uncinocarpus reesii 1704]EEP83051.1 predicted protein [Uncinocarpus reesii 1704]
MLLTTLFKITLVVSGLSLIEWFPRASAVPQTAGPAVTTVTAVSSARPTNMSGWVAVGSTKTRLLSSGFATHPALYTGSIGGASATAPSQWPSGYLYTNTGTRPSFLNTTVVPSSTHLPKVPTTSLAPTVNAAEMNTAEIYSRFLVVLSVVVVLLF